MAGAGREVSSETPLMVVTLAELLCSRPNTRRGACWGGLLRTSIPGAAAGPATPALRPLVRPLEPGFEGSGSADKSRLLGSFSKGVSGLALSRFHSGKSIC